MNDVEEDEGYLQDPYIGGYNSDKAEILIVNFTPDPSLYKPDMNEKQLKTNQIKQSQQ